MKRLKAVMPLCLMVLAVFLFSSCVESDKESKPELKVGIIAVTSGEMFRKGNYIITAARYAVEKVKAEGGVDISGKKYAIKLFPVDSGGTGDIAAKMALRLIKKDKVSVIVGGVSSNVAIAVAEVCEKYDIPFITPVSGLAKLTTLKYSFRVSYTNKVQALALSKFVMKELNAESVAVLYDTKSSYSSELALCFKDAYEKENGKVVAFEKYTQGDRKYRSQIKRIVASGAKILFLPNNTKKIQLQARQARQAGFKGILLGGDSWDPIELARNKLFQGSYYADHWFPGIPLKVSGVFEKGFKKATGAGPTEIEALTYDAMTSLFAAVKHARSIDPVAIHDSLVEMPPYAGVTGTFDYNNSGDPDKDVFISNLRDGYSVLSDVVYSN